MRESARTYGPSNLYEYIDGSADLFLSYGFVGLAVGDYVPTAVAQVPKPAGKSEGWISVDVYNMGTPLSAFGIFGAERPNDKPVAQVSRPAEAGQEPLQSGAQGYCSEGLTAFWKGHYYVKVSLIEGEDRAAARRLAELTAERIAAEPAMPAELGRLPADNRVPGSERYAKKDALGHKFLVEVVSANYKLGDSLATLHIADLGSPEKAAEGLAKLREFEASTAEVADLPGVGAGCFAVRDTYYGEMVAARSGRFLVIGVSEKAKREALRDLVGAGVQQVVGMAGASSWRRDGR
jgi:hypothetical protein